MPVGRREASPRRELMNDHVDIATLTVVPVIPEVYHRSRGQAGAAEEDTPGVQGTPGRGRVGPVPLGHVIEVGVVASDIAIEGQELGLRELAAIQNVEAVLHAEIAEGPGREPGRWVDTVDVHRVVVHGGPNPVRL